MKSRVVNMNQEERINAVFEGRKPDRLPWFADLVFWYFGMRKRGELPPQYYDPVPLRGGVYGEGRVRLYKDLGCGAHEELFISPVKVEYTHVDVRVFEERYNDGTEITTYRFITPLGELERVWKFTMDGMSTALVKYPVQNAKDLKILRYILKDAKIRVDENLYELQRRWMEQWKGIGIVSSLAPRAPMSTLFVELAGVTNTSVLYFKARSELEETLQVLGEAFDPFFEAIEESPARYVYFGDNISSDVVNPKFFRDYYIPYYKRRSEQLHRKKKYIFLHIDGTLRGVLELVKFTGIDCAQSLTPAPVGDVPLEKFRELAGNDVIIWGGLPGVYFSPRYPPELLKNMMEEIIELYLYDSKFIVGVADEVPPDGDIKRVRMITDIIEENPID